MDRGGLIIDLFAGGGGASLGLQWAGLPVDIAVNHDAQAVAMHKINHPETYHYCCDIKEVDPVKAVKGRPVKLLWASPDCKHFSKASGKAIRERKIRALAWTVWKWARKVRPDIIILENVEEFVSWGPLVDGKPDQRRKELTFKSWVGAFKRKGYKVEWRELTACDYGAPTSRKRFFLIARCDGFPIVWPEATHGPGRKPYRTAAECLDFSLPCHSIFLTKEEAKAQGLNIRRPLAENTLRRIAQGIKKFVIENPKPFIISYYGMKKTDEFRGIQIENPLPTQTTENRFALVEAFLSRQFGRSIGNECRNPAPTTTAGGGGKTALVTSNLLKLRGTCRHGQSVGLPAATITSGGQHLAEVRAFLIKYYSTNVGLPLLDPIHTITSKPRFGLVTVQGEEYQITDIGMRMLTARELYRAQGFPDSYVIDFEFDRKPLPKAAQVRLVGNSVCPQLAAALARANVGVESEIRKAS